MHKILHLGKVKKRPYGLPLIKPCVPVTTLGIEFRGIGEDAHKF